MLGSTHADNITTETPKLLFYVCVVVGSRPVLVVPILIATLVIVWTGLTIVTLHYKHPITITITKTKKVAAPAIKPGSLQFFRDFNCRYNKRPAAAVTVVHNNSSLILFLRNYITSVIHA